MAVKRSIDQVLEGLDDHSKDLDMALEIRSLLELRKADIGVVDVKFRDSLHDIYGEIGDFADQLRIISPEIDEMLKTYLQFFVKGVVSENSGKRS